MKACLEKIVANQEKVQTKMEAYLERMEVNQEKLEAMGLEANPESLMNRL